MGRKGRRGGRRNRFPARTVPFDCVGNFQATTKIINHADLGFTATRSFRVIAFRFQVVSKSSDFPVAVQVSVYNPEASDICYVSRPSLTDHRVKVISGRLPRFMDFGDVGTKNVNTPVLIFSYVGNASGTVYPTIYFTGTVWIQYAPHKIPSAVSRAIAMRAAEEADNDIRDVDSVTSITAGMDMVKLENF